MEFYCPLLPGAVLCDPQVDYCEDCGGWDDDLQECLL